MAATEHGLKVRRQPRLKVAERAFALSSSDRKFLLAALGGLIAARILAIFAFPFVDTTEARYAEIARIMLETGDWITPQFDYGIPFWGKPPLHTWLSAAGMAVFGVGEFGARIFIFATALGVLGLTFAWVRRQTGFDQALLATVILFSSVLFMGASAFVMTDMVMLLGLTLSMVSFQSCIMSVSSATLWGRLFFVGLAIGLLAKGPVAVVLTGIPIVPWLFITGHWRRLGCVPWVSGIAILAAMTVPWYTAAELKTPGFLHYFLVGEHFERFVVSGWEGDRYGSGHARPLGIIWAYWIATFMPWTLLVIPLLWRAFIERPASNPKDKGWHSYLALWILSPLLLFTPAANLLSAYVLPSLPPTAMLLVSCWSIHFGPPGRWVRMVGAAAIGGLTALFVVLSGLVWFSPQSLALKTERELVQFAYSVDPDMNFTYWGSRSFSADFYTRSTATYANRTAAFEALLTNDMRDAVAIRTDVAQDLTPFLKRGFENMGQFGRRVLFIEAATPEDAS